MEKSKRESLNVRMRRGYDREMEWGTNLSPWAHLSQNVLCKESSNEDDTKETLLNKQTQSTHESSVGVLVRVHMLQDCGHIKHVVVFVVLLCVIISVVISVLTYSHFTCMWIPCKSL